MRKTAKQHWLPFGLFILLVPAIASFAPGQPPVEVPFMPLPSTQTSFTEKPGSIKGWNQIRMVGPYPQPEQYEYGISDEVFYKGRKCAFIRSATDDLRTPYMSGELFQMFKANRYRNKRMRFSAVVKSDVIDMSAALSMSVLGRMMISYDDMYGRNITGSREWERYKVVLDVPEESDFINIGFRVRGKGEIWLSSVAFDETKDEPTADPMYGSEPSNLDFSSEA